MHEITESPMGQMVVKKDDPKQTVLQDPKTGTTTIIDKRKNPQASIQQDPKNPQKAMMKNPNATTATGAPGQKKTVIKPGTKVTITK